MDLTPIKNKIIDGVKLVIVQPTVYFTLKLQDAVFGVDYREKEVEPFQSGRPDLIALDAYGEASMADIILKFNGISDPFSIVEGEIIKIPKIDYPFKRLERVQNREENSIKQQFVNTKRLSKKDQRRAEAMKKKYDKETLLPPNVIPVGKKTFKFEAGNITFGAQAQNDTVVNSITNPGKNKFNSSGLGIGTDQLNDMLNR
jgi:hypothetical protein